MRTLKRFLFFITILSSFCVEMRADEETPAPYIPRILIVESDEEAAELESRGVVIWRRRADMALALVPRDLEMPMRKRGESGLRHEYRAIPVMDRARRQFDAYKITTGEDLPRPYSGKGVVVGFCDSGFDPNHIAFLDDDGNSRVKLLVYYDEPKGIRQVVDTPEQIAAWTTDNPDDYHGTHVANIMAGSYSANGLQGMAPGVEIVATTSMLYDAGILSACEDIIEYANEVGKPAVINLSLSSYNGPRDGSSLFCRYMDLLGEEAVVFISIGNAGDSHMSKQLTFTADKPTWRVRLGSTDWKQFRIMGYTDAWSADSRPLGVRLLIYDDYEKKTVFEDVLLPAGTEYSHTLSSDDNPEMARYLTGMVKVHGGISELNGRWVTEMEYDTQCSEVHPASDGSWARYRLSLEFTAEAGTEADITADGYMSWFNTYPGFSAPGNELSFNDMCTGKNTIGVGMYTTRNSYEMLNGETRTFGIVEGEVSTMSSYGTSRDGRVFPQTVAPGAGIISACNNHYTAAHPEVIPYLAGRTTAEGREDYWEYTIGTSMSAPYTAGVVATWIEADPSLTVGEIRDIIISTNARVYPDASNPRHGEGWLRPYEGLKEVIRNTSVSAGAVDAAEPKIVLCGNGADILNPSGSPFDITITDTEGRIIRKTANVHERVYRLDMSDLSRGILLLSVMPANGKPVTVKIAR